MKYYCNPLDENSTLNMDNGGKSVMSKLATKIGKASSYSREPTTPKVHPSKREEFDQFCLYQLDNLSDTDKKELYSWHVSEMNKLLDRVEKEVIGEDEEPFGNNDDTVDGMNSLRWEQRKKLNNLKEELK